MEETTIIARLGQSFASLPQGVFGIGDDAALIPADAGANYVISKDQMAENVHFRLRYATPESLAHKALHTNLSDMAAMGVAARFILLGLALPSTLDNGWIEKFTGAFAAACRQNNVLLIGGDTTGADGKLFISVTIIGHAPEAQIKFRHTAKAGDIIFAAGALGESFAGLTALEQNKPGFDEMKEKSLRPTALAAEGLWLGQQACVTAMMDVSDGLYIDLSRMMARSGISAQIEVSALHPSRALQTACTELGIDPMQAMLAGGEDYALLFTCAPQAADELARSFECKFGYGLQRVGQTQAGKNIRLMRNGAEVPFAYQSFAHFAAR